MSWRESARTIIQRVIREVGTDDLKALKKAISEAYPFGQRSMHPYKIWLDEVKFQLGQKPVKQPGKIESIPGQKEMF